MFSPPDASRMLKVSEWLCPAPPYPKGPQSIWEAKQEFRRNKEPLPGKNRDAASPLGFSTACSSTSAPIHHVACSASSLRVPIHSSRPNKTPHVASVARPN